MKKIMHINRRNTESQGFVWTLCGVLLWPGEGAPKDAPMCPKCVSKNNRGPGRNTG